VKLRLKYKRLIETKNFAIAKEKSQNVLKKQMQNSIKRVSSPQMCLKSKVMAEKQLKQLKQELGDQDYTVLMLKKREKEVAETRKKRQEKEEREMKECKFQPSISKASSSLAQSRKSQSRITDLKNVFNDLHKSQLKKQGYAGKTSEQVEFERSKDEMTFQPNKHLRRTP